jgi:hypothetical protein
LFTFDGIDGAKALHHNKTLYAIGRAVSLMYAIVGLAVWVFYRELTKFSSFSGITRHSLTHGHHLRRAVKNKPPWKQFPGRLSYEL